MTKQGLKFEKFWAQFISTLFNPFFVIIFTFTAANYSILINQFGEFLLFLSIVFLPVFVIYIQVILKHKKHPIHFISIERTQRDKIYLIGVYSLLFATIIFANFNLSFWFLHSILLAIYISTLYLVNKYIDKASVHASTFAFAVLYLTDKVNLAYALLFFILPLIFWSRIELHKHTWIQLLLGAVIGMVIGLLSWSIKV